MDASSTIKISGSNLISLSFSFSFSLLSPIVSLDPCINVQLRARCSVENMIFLVASYTEAYLHEFLRFFCASPVGAIIAIQDSRSSL